MCTGPIVMTEAQALEAAARLFGQNAFVLRAGGLPHIGEDKDSMVCRVGVVDSSVHESVLWRHEDGSPLATLRSPHGVQRVLGSGATWEDAIAAAIVFWLSGGEKK